MKTRPPLLLALLLPAAVSLTSRTHAATTYLVGLSPHYATSDQRAILQELLLFSLEDMAIGDQMVCYDAFNQQAVARLALPEQKFFAANPRSRAQHLKAPIAELRSFLTSQRVCPPELTAAINLPQFLDLAGAQLRKPGEPLQVIIIGSPFYVDPKNHAYDQAESYPSDAHLLAEPSQSPFSTKLRKHSLAGLTIHYAYLRDNFSNPYHRERMIRFLALFAKEQQGLLATCAPDVRLAFQRARDHAEQPCVEARLDPLDTKIEMRSVVPRSVPVWLVATNPVPLILSAQATPAPATPPTSGAMTLTNPVPLQPKLALASVAASEPESKRNSIPIAAPAASDSVPVRAVSAESKPASEQALERLSVGISWTAHVDCDLYLRPAPTSPELSYNCRITKEGRFFQDTSSVNQGMAWEMVELNPPFDPRQLSCWVNLYSGKAPRISGVVCVHYRNRTYYGEFTIQAKKGNKGEDAQNRSKSPYWTEIDVSRILDAHALAEFEAARPRSP